MRKRACFCSTNWIFIHICCRWHFILMRTTCFTNKVVHIYVCIFLKTAIYILHSRYVTIVRQFGEEKNCQTLQNPWKINDLKTQMAFRERKKRSTLCMRRCARWWNKSSPYIPPEPSEKMWRLRPHRSRTFYTFSLLQMFDHNT